MKNTTFIISLMASQISFGYTNVDVTCRVNHGIYTNINCDDSWVSMANYSNIEIQLKTCINARFEQEVQVRIDDETIYSPSPGNLNFSASLDGYLIECLKR